MMFRPELFDLLLLRSQIWSCQHWGNMHTFLLFERTEQVATYGKRGDRTQSSPCIKPGQVSGPVHPGRGPERSLLPAGSTSLDTSPLSPFSPFCPAGPSFPVKPSSPGSPFSPGIPVAPGSPEKNNDILACCARNSDILLHDITWCTLKVKQLQQPNS